MNRAQVRCGDALEELAILETGSIRGIVTDPPYSSGSRQQVGARGKISKSKRPDSQWFGGDCMGGDSYLRWMRLIALEGMRVVAEGGTAAVFTDWRQYTTLVTAWESAGWTLKAVVVWDKAKAGGLGTFWRNNHEWVCIFSKGAAAWPKGFGQFNTWTGAKPRGGEHPTEKPVELCRFLCRGVTPVGGCILDPFAGSGTSGVAALLEGFEFIGIERDARYVELARGRLEAVPIQSQTTIVPENGLLETDLSVSLT